MVRAEKSQPANPALVSGNQTSLHLETRLSGAGGQSKLTSTQEHADTSEIPRVIRREDADAKKGRQRQTWVFPFQTIGGFGRSFRITKTFCLIQMKTDTGLSPISQPQEVYASLLSFPLEIRNIRTRMDFL